MRGIGWEGVAESRGLTLAEPRAPEEAALKVASRRGRVGRAVSEARREANKQCRRRGAMTVQFVRKSDPPCISCQSARCCPQTRHYSSPAYATPRWEKTR